jgi:YidC/Oxa1 family membrane protein insertase
MERRVFIAVILSFVVLYGFQALFPPPEAPATPGTTAPAPANAPAAPAAGAAPAPGDSTAAAPLADPAPQPAAIAARVSEAAGREIVVDTALARIVLSNVGGRVLQWQLKGYTDANGGMVDLVPSDLPAEQPRPFSLAVPDAAITRRMQSAIYRVTGDVQGRVDAQAQAREVVFEYEDEAGLAVRKSLQFEPQRHLVRFSASVRSGEAQLNPTVLWGPGLGDSGASAGGGSFFTGNYVQPPQAIYQRESSVERHAADALVSQPVHEGNFQFVGVDDHYFVATAVKGGQTRAEFKPVTIPGAAGTQRQLVSAALTFSQAPQNVMFFVGPKQFDALQQVDSELVRVINFGMFAWLVVPLLSTLKWMFGFVGNYGWSIIVLTIVLNLAMFPLRHRSAVAMKKMQTVQPLMQAIQKRYSHLKMTDPARQKMNEEIAALYKQHGVNPASGCVPMLLTFPVLLAFYSLLSQSIELRGAPFVGWIHDLSAADPYYVLPILMGGTMMWQQWITPAAMDPAQQRIMMIMPVMFTTMMLFSPSGVVLYWFVNQIWAIGQQYFTNWIIGPKTQARVPALSRK